MSSESSRFQHLLQPIRDLSKNWNIDLAQELEEYLDELEHLTIAFDASGVSSASAQLMNFAEAALLIQGTSMIYSRKVEYLYALVFQTLAHLSKQQNDAVPTADGDAHGDSDGDDDDDGGENGERETHGGARKKRARQGIDVFANPLPIFDELEEAKNITLRRATSSSARQSQRHDVVKTKNNIQASIALMGSLVPDERDHGETFKLLSCHLHTSGVLLMDEASKKYLKEEQELPLPSASQRIQHTPMAKLNFDALDTSMASDASAFDHNDAGNDDGGGDDDDDDDNNEPVEDPGYDFGGYDEPADNDEPKQEPLDTDDIFAQPIKPEPVENEDARSSTPKATATTTRAAAAPDVKDPWAPLDPYDASKSTVRPFRKGRSYPVRGTKKLLANKKKKKLGEDEDEIDGVDDPAFKERFLLSANRPQWSTWVWNDLDERALETKFKKKYCKAPCLMTSCESLWRLEAKWKSMMRKHVAAEEQSANAILLQEQAEEEEEEQMQAMTMDMNDAFVTNPEVHEVDGGDDDDDDDDGDNGVDYGGGDDDWGQDTDAYPLLDGTAVLKNNGLGQPAIEDNGELALSYEEICRQHLEEFMKGTEKYIRETDLTRQVNDWQEKLNPILREQDAHPPFDIHKYGRNILEHLETSTGSKKKKMNPKRRKRQEEEEEEVEDAAPVPFGDVVSGLSQFEVCRMFLASLQLANNGNVQLHHGKTAADQTLVPFEMQLLTTSNVYESLQHETVAT